MEPIFLVEDYFNKLSDHKTLNFDVLGSYIREQEIPFAFHDFPYPYDGAVGATHPEYILLNRNQLLRIADKDQYHVILHEIGHYMRIRKVGVDAINKKIATATSYEEFFDHLYEEECFAEKFALLYFYRFNGFLDNSNVKLLLNDEKMKSTIRYYAASLYKSLKASGMTFFEHTKSILKYQGN